MSKNNLETALTVVTVPISQIRVLNPRVRGRRHFQEVVQSIAAVGLKRPITVSPRKSDFDACSYDLVCGQGRLEAFLQLGQCEIPAIVTSASEDECLVMSLVENCARRQHSATELLQDIGSLRKRGYSDRDIADKIGLSTEYVHGIAHLIECGEGRLITAVEAGILPLHMAIEIAKSTDDEVQRALTEAYLEKRLRGKKLIAVRRLIEQRQRRGKRLENKIGRPNMKRPLTGDSIVRVYRQEADRQKVMIKRAEVTQGHLLFVVEAFRTLCSDITFATLLKSESLDSMPSILIQRLEDGASQQ